MDHSPGSAERRANLIRQMARYPDRNHSRASNPSSNASAQGEENAYDTKSKQIPPVRLNHDYQLNSSAIKRAFPDFSQGSTSDEDSIEIGRGASKATPNKSILSEDVTEDMPFSFGNGAKYQITATPPIWPKNANIKSKSLPQFAGNENNFPTLDGEDKENQPNAARKMSDMNATIDSDNSPFVARSRAKPANLDGGKRSSRFGSRKGKPSTEVEQPAQNGTNTSIISAANGTHQSFVLPDMPNITELISGVRQDGTPLFTRSAKSRSRFGTPSHNGRSAAAKQGHFPLEDAPATLDDKALYASLQLLQDKVAALEFEKAETEMKLDDYELEVLQLRSKLEEMEQRRNSDSGLGTDPEELPTRPTPNEKSKLELAIKTLQTRLDSANRKASKSEVTIQSLHKDRDAAHQQLAVAFLNSEELKNEGQAMRDEIGRIKDQIARLNRNHEKKLDQLSKQETELRAKIERREKAINEMSSLVKELWQTRKALAKHTHDEAATLRSPAQISEPLQTKKTRQTGTNVRNEQKLSSAKISYDSEPKAISGGNESANNNRHAQKLNNDRHIENDAEEDHLSDVESTTNIRFERHSFTAEDLSKNATYLSFMEGDEVAKLRSIVNEDKQKLARNGTDPKNAAATKLENKALPRKSSLKRVSYQNEHGGVIRDDNTVDNVTRASMSTRVNTPYVNPSLNSQATAVRYRSAPVEQPDMTSAFILPDITLSGQLGMGAAGKQTICIPRPVPVSERNIELAEGDGDMTERPAQSPAVALAAVLKGLEDELDQLRGEVARQEALYNQHDPALSKRKRKIVYARIQKLLSAIEIRSDQIYALYDVLEGQKASGQTMNEEEVEITLQHIGIDPEILQFQKADHGKERRTVPHPDESALPNQFATVDDDESEELPWEGFEPTQTNTLDNTGRFRLG